MNQREAKNSDSLICLAASYLHIRFEDCHKHKTKSKGGLLLTGAGVLAQICVEFGKLVGAVCTYVGLEVVAFPALVEPSLVFPGLKLRE